MFHEKGMSDMTIGFVGHGYVGLVTAAIFADLGNTVWVVGRTKEKIEKLKRGEATFYEPGLSEIVKRNVDAGRLLFTLDYKELVVPSEIIFICVGTPPKPNGEADLTEVWNAAAEIGKNLVGYKVVSVKSTVPPGTNKRVGEILTENKPAGSSFALASCPEFLRQGQAVSDTMHPHRVVIGTTSERAEKLLIDLHKSIDAKVVTCNLETAELIKYSSNSMLSVKISFANAIAFLSEKVGADAEKVLEAVGLDSRIGRTFLYPGVGYGGSCFPKDVKALIAIADQYGYNFKLLKATDEINDEARLHFINKIMTHFGGDVKDKKFCLLGCSFKPDTDDMRFAPSITVATALVKAGASVVAYDPVAMDNAKKVMPAEVTYAANPYDAAKDADATIVVTEWNEFKKLDLVKLAGLMTGRVLFDGRNIYEPEEMKKLGYTYYGVGRM
jgi:UDPglucose 6-dehydrogenase